MSSLSTKEREVKFNKLSNDLNNKRIAFCSNLLFGTLVSPSGYFDIESNALPNKGF